MIKDRVSNILMLSEKISEEIEGIKSESGQLSVSDTAKNSILENINEIDAFLERVHVLSNEVIDFSEQDNMNLKFHERRLMVLALKKNEGHRHLSAQDLKITSRTLLRKIKEYKISKLEYATTGRMLRYSR